MKENIVVFHFTLQILQCRKLLDESFSSEVYPSSRFSEFGKITKITKMALPTRGPASLPHSLEQTNDAASYRRKSFLNEEKRRQHCKSCPVTDWNQDEKLQRNFNEIKFVTKK